MKKFFLVLFGLSALFSFSFSGAALALESDRSQPATLDADEFELDFQTGVRTYRGNVVYQQGTIRLYADEIVAYFKDDTLERVIARGNPAKFSQRPDKAETDVVGVALRIEMDDKRQLVTLQDRAKVTQNSNVITGKKITYDMVTDKVNVRSGKRKIPKVSPVENELELAIDAAKEGLKDQMEMSTENRPRLVIKPRK